MNLAIAQTFTAQPLMQVVKNDERLFQTRYLQGLNLVTVRGWSVTQDIHSKYAQLLIDIESHFKTHDSLNIYFKYKLFNSTSLRYLFMIIRSLNEAHANGKTVKIYWSCDTENDAEMMDMGIDLANMSDFKFDISYL